MPYALCPMPYALCPRVPHMRARKAISPYSPDFNHIELWWSQLKYFLGKFYPITTKVIDTLIAGSLDLINPQYLKNCFTKCCYCHL